MVHWRLEDILQSPQSPTRTWLLPKALHSRFLLCELLLLHKISKTSATTFKFARCHPPSSGCTASLGHLGAGGISARAKEVIQKSPGQIKLRLPQASVIAVFFSSSSFPSPFVSSFAEVKEINRQQSRTNLTPCNVTCES